MSRLLLPLLWWLACIAPLGASAALGYVQLHRQPLQLHWQYSQQRAFSAQLTRRLNQIMRSHAQDLSTDRSAGMFASLPANLSANLSTDKSADLRTLAMRLANLPWVRSASLAKLSGGGLHLGLTPFMPWVLLNNDTYINLQGETKPREPGITYNPGRRLQLPPDQLQQFFPAIGRLNAQLANEGLALQQLSITPSGIWTVTLSRGWLLYFGPNPDFALYFARLRLALAQILARGKPASFDFRYQNAIAVSYQ